MYLFLKKQDIGSAWENGLFIACTAFGDAEDRISSVLSHVFYYQLSQRVSRDILTLVCKMLIHIGSMIKDVYEHASKTITIQYIARKLNCRRENIYNIFRRATIDTQLLINISEALEHDFFADISEKLRVRQRNDNTTHERKDRTP